MICYIFHRCLFLFDFLYKITLNLRQEERRFRPSGWAPVGLWLPPSILAGQLFRVNQPLGALGPRAAQLSLLQQNSS